LALNHQTAKLLVAPASMIDQLRLALNHQTAKLVTLLRPCSKGLFSCLGERKTASRSSE
jgi:hypothetical protein